MAIRFRNNIRGYNNSLAFSSLGCNIDNSVAGQMGIYTFRIKGALSHRIGSLLPSLNQMAKFAQIYVYESSSDNQIQTRMSYHHGQLDEITLRALQATLRACNNPYYEAFLSAGERLRNNEHVSLRLNTVQGSMNQDHRRYNLPTVSEVAAILPDSENMESGSRDIVIQRRSGQLTRVSEYHSCYLPMRYPLIFPQGEQGFHLQDRINNFETYSPFPFHSNFYQSICHSYSTRVLCLSVA